MLEELIYHCAVGTPRVDEKDPGARALSVRVESMIANTNVLAFRLDTEHGRRALGLRASDRICDALLLGIRSVPGEAPRVGWLLVELKLGAKVVPAFEQLETALDALESKLSTLIDAGAKGRGKIAIVLRTATTAPLDIKSYQRRFKGRAMVSVLTSADATQILKHVVQADEGPNKS